MKKLLTITLSLLFLFSACVTTIKQPPLDPRELTDRAAYFLTTITMNEPELAWEKLDDTMKEFIPEPFILTAAWAQIVELVGEPLGVASIISIGRTTEIHMEHENPALLSATSIYMNAYGEVIGLNFNIIANPAHAPDFSEAMFTEEPVTVGAGGAFPLPGLLTMPLGVSSPVPAVVLVHGSGPGDMDQTINAIKPFRDIAYFLAENGIATLRYDKRTFAHGETMAASMEDFADFTVFEETIEDAVLAKELLMDDPRIDSERIYVAGLSLGGILAPEIATLGDFAGMIIMAGTMRPLTELMVEQYIYLLEDQPEEVAAPFIAEVTLGHEIFLEALEMEDEELKSTFIMGASVYYFVDLYRRPPAPFIQAWERPGLILHGDMDYQCRWYIDFVAYKDLTYHMDNFNAILYPGLTHLFTQSHSTTDMGTNMDYLFPESVSTYVLTDIVNFILGID